MGKKSKTTSGKENDSDTIQLTCGDSLGIPQDNLHPASTNPPSGPEEIPKRSQTLNPMLSNPPNTAQKFKNEADYPPEATVDMMECEDMVDEDDYNFRMKYRTEMTWQLSYFLIWNFLARHQWTVWIEFAGVVLVYSLVGLFGSLNPSRYPASWCLWSVKCYVWLNPFMQVYNALWLTRVLFMESVFWFTYVTMIMNFGVLYCGYVSASEYYENDLIHFMQRYFQLETHLSDDSS
ncbi:hypothetical protein LEN26_006018 [Aphanomyces euteiches]|nr:hypothetical protein AeMF1_002645 [Aphanomyces euteiches]KAH9136727.1 hypothetical protein LEN26_006018 [Aphanomyces euteiches]KAH9191644.1 hypothetical protein AeNC1_006388 [Aphanomyces euteiches]